MSDSSYCYINEIRDMMYGYGDSKNPLFVSAQMIEHIVYEQMKSLIKSASECAALRGFSLIGHEDILFLMRKNRVKIRRLLKYMEIKDIKSNVTSCCNKTDGEAPAAEEEPTPPELGVEIKPKPSKKTRIEKCTAFLKYIDDTGELRNVFDDRNIYDEEKTERLNRQNKIAIKLNAIEYLDFHKARQAGFHESCNFNKSKFKRWLYKNEEKPAQITTIAFEMICYLAHETVATIVNACLKMKEEKKCRGHEKSSAPSFSYSEIIDLGLLSVPQILLQYNLSQEIENLPAKDDETSEDYEEKIVPHDILEVIYGYYSLHRPVDTNFTTANFKESSPKFLCF